MRLWILAITSLAACFTAAAAEREHSMAFGGRQRIYTVIAPDKTSAPLPLIVVFHGGGEPASNARRYSRFDEFAESQGFVVVYPQGLDNNWNDGRESADLSRRAAASVDDVDFTRQIIAKLVMDGRADPARVFLTGASNGGMMAMRAGCEMSGEIAGIAPVIANRPVDWTCNGGPLPALFIHGTEDEFMPYAGGQIAVGKTRQDLGQVISADDTIAEFMRLNGCTGEEEPKTLDKVGRDETKAIIHDYTCSKAALKHIVIEGGGHTWPGARARLLAGFVLGRTSAEVSATAEIWNFFKSLPPR